MTLEPQRRLLRGALAILVLAMGSGFAAGSPRAESAETGVEEPDAAGAPAQEATQEPPAFQSSATLRARRHQRQKEWWIHAREALFSDIELDAEQAHGVEAIIEAQLRNRARFQELDAEFKAARRRADAERSAAIRAELRAVNAQLRQQHELFEEMRALLTPEQRPIFDTNRARFAAESRADWRARREERGGRREERTGTKVE
jgi:hypothetical protein